MTMMMMIMMCSYIKWTADFQTVSNCFSALSFLVNPIVPYCK